MQSSLQYRMSWDCLGILRGQGNLTRDFMRQSFVPRHGCLNINQIWSAVWGQVIRLWLSRAFPGHDQLTMMGIFKVRQTFSCQAIKIASGYQYIKECQKRGTVGFAMPHTMNWRYLFSLLTLLSSFQPSFLTRVCYLFLSWKCFLMQASSNSINILTSVNFGKAHAIKVKSTPYHGPFCTDNNGTTSVAISKILRKLRNLFSFSMTMFDALVHVWHGKQPLISTCVHSC